MRTTVFALAMLTLVTLVGCAQSNASSDPVGGKTTSSTEGPASIKVDTQGRKYIVDPDKILSGGPPKDGIPSLDNPKFVSVSEADRWIRDNELVLAIDYKGVKRVYPLARNRQRHHRRGSDPG